MHERCPLPYRWSTRSILAGGRWHCQRDNVWTFFSGGEERTRTSSANLRRHTRLSINTSRLRVSRKREKEGEDSRKKKNTQFAPPPGSAPNFIYQAGPETAISSIECFNSYKVFCNKNAAGPPRDDRMGCMEKEEQERKTCRVRQSGGMLISKAT